MIILVGDLYLPRTQMTLVLIEKGLVLEGWSPKIEDKQVPGIYIYSNQRYSRGPIILIGRLDFPRFFLYRI